MVRGISKQAVIVKSPDLKLFEEAIFILSAESGGGDITNASDMLELATSLANKYAFSPLGGPKRLKRRGIHPLLSFCLGAAAVGLVWAYCWLTLR